MSAQPLSTPFAFDTEFDDTGRVLSAAVFRPIKRAYSPAEVEALVAQARVEAREQALAESAALQAAALAAIGEATTQALGGLTQSAHAHRDQSAELALACARLVCAQALDRFPQGPLQAALEALGQDIDASPRLVVRMAGLDEPGRELLRQVCADAGFSGQVAFRDEPGLPPAGFELEWSDGRAAFDPADSFARMDEALKSALAAEAGHAETLSDGSR